MPLQKVVMNSLHFPWQRQCDHDTPIIPGMANIGLRLSRQSGLPDCSLAGNPCSRESGSTGGHRNPKGVIRQGCFPAGEATWP